MNFKIKNKIWIETNNNALLGEGRVLLLIAIDQTGSLSKAAKSINMSYKKAWTLIDAINKSAIKPVTKSSIGGKGGGGVKVTTYGKKLINAFVTINKNCRIFLDEQIKIMNNI